MDIHADSQITDEEATRLMLATLGSPEHRGSRRLAKGKAIGRQDMLGRWVTDTPEGPLHEVAHVRVLDGEPFWQAYYRDEDDALAVWDHLSEEIETAKT